MALSLVSYDYFNVNSVVGPPNGPWASDPSFDPSRDSILISAANNPLDSLLRFTGGIVAQVGAGSLGVPGQTMSFSYSWTGCLYVALQGPQAPQGSLTVLESVGGNSFSADIDLCGQGRSTTVERSGTLVLDADASTTIRMFNQNIDTGNRGIIWTLMSKISLTLIPGPRPSTSGLSANSSWNESLTHSSSQPPSVTTLSSREPSSSATSHGSFGSSGLAVTASSSSGTTIIVGPSSTQGVSSRSSGRTSTPSIVGVVAGVLLFISLA